MCLYRDFNGKLFENWISTAKSSPVAGITLHTAYCMLHAAPASVPAHAH